MGRYDVWLDPALEPIWRDNDMQARSGAYLVEERSEHPTRGSLTYESVKFPLLDGDGELYATCGVSLDTTERRRAVERLGEAEKCLTGAFENAPNGMALVGLDGRFMQVNAAFCEITGYAEEQLERMTAFDITHPDDVEARGGVPSPLARRVGPTVWSSGRTRTCRRSSSAASTQRG